MTVPFTRFNKAGGDEGNKEGNKLLNRTQVEVLAEIRNNPNITKSQLCIVCNVGKTAVDRSIDKLKMLGFIKRVGSRKIGYWEVLK